MNQPNSISAANATCAPAKHYPTAESRVGLLQRIKRDVEANAAIEAVMVRAQAGEEDPVMRYTLVDVFGDKVDEWFEIRASELINGIESWPGKISESEQMKRTYDMYPDLLPE